MKLVVTLNKLKSRRQLFRIYFVGFLLNLLWIISQSIALYLIKYSENSVRGILIIVPFIIVWIFLDKKKFFQETKNTGLMELSKTQIIITKGDNTRLLFLSEITDLRIYFHSYKGMRMNKLIFDGDMNKISFINNKEKEEYQFNLDSLEHFEELKLLFNEFYENGVKFKEYYWKRRSYQLRTGLTYNEIQMFKEKHKIEWI